MRRNIIPLSFLVLALTFPTFAEEAREPQNDNSSEEATISSQAPVEVGNDVLFLDFENPDTLIDESDALRSKQYVRRAILNNAIEATSKFAFGRIYLNHLMGFSAIFQTTRFAKYSTGLQALSLGYVTEGGHGFEAGLEASGVSNVFAGYRYFFRPERFSLWPFLGIGGGTEVNFITIADGPENAQNYNGFKQFGFFTTGLMIPLVDVAFKAEFRLELYKFNRIVLSQGIGAVLFF